VVIPWYIADEVWRVNVRRPVRGEDDGSKYIGPPGFSAGLYGADGFRPDVPAVLVEGEFDALTITQTAGELVTAVATGSTAGARRLRWIARIAARPLVLVAFDADDAGEAAARYWCETLPNARRWRPYVHDVNDMHRGGMDVRAWIAAGLEYAGDATRRPPPVQNEPGELPPEVDTLNALGHEDTGNSNGNTLHGRGREDDAGTTTGTTTLNARVPVPSALSVDVPELPGPVAPLPELRDVPQRLERELIEDIGEDDGEWYGPCSTCGGKTYARRARDGVWICFWCFAPATAGVRIPATLSVAIATARAA